MRVNEENVLIEMKNILEIIQEGYEQSNSITCDRLLNEAMGKLGTLISILSVTKDN